MNGLLQRGVYRPTQEPIKAVLPAARSTGHYRVSSGWKQPPVSKYFVQLFWGIDGNGRFVGPDGGWDLHPEEICCYFPGDKHDLEPATPIWEYCWMTFDGDSCMDIIRILNLQRSPSVVGKCPQELFRRLEDELRDFSSMGQYQAGITAYNILIRAAGAVTNKNRSSDVIERFKAIVTARYSDLALNVSSLADELHIHRCTLARLFRLHTGMSPVDYLIGVRVGEAMTLLANSDLKIGEIAFRCGFHDLNYFVKVIKKRTGLTPGAFRKN